MATTVGTLAQEVDDKIEYIYPKTLASVVEYDESDSVKDKIQKMDKNMADVNTRINNIAKGIKFGSLGTHNDAELIDIRTPNYNIAPDGIIYDSAGEAIRSQFEEVIKIINEMKSDIEYIKQKII